MDTKLKVAFALSALGCLISVTAYVLAVIQSKREARKTKNESNKN